MLGCGILLEKVLQSQGRLKPPLCGKPCSTWGTAHPALQQPHLHGRLTVSRLWSRTGSRIRPLIQAFTERLANHTQGTQNVLCGRLNFSKCLCSAGVIKPVGWREEAVGGEAHRRWSRDPGFRPC